MLKEQRGILLENIADVTMAIVGLRVRLDGATRRRVIHTVRVVCTLSAKTMFHVMLSCNALGHVRLNRLKVQTL